MMIIDIPLDMGLFGGVWAFISHDNTLHVQ